MSRLRLHLIACRVFERELAALVAQAKAAVTIRYLEVGLHDREAAHLHDALQAAIDETSPESCDAIGLVYGLCNRGLLGLQARQRPVVIPRAHDCIGILLGHTCHYLAQLAAHPGSYFQSPGWVEHLPASRSSFAEAIPMGDGVVLTRAELIERFGEDDARYLLEQYAGAQGQRELIYIASPVPETEKWEREAQTMAQRHGWQFARLPGDLGWLRELLDGDWREERFLTLAPGERSIPLHDGRLIGAEKPPA